MKNTLCVYIIMTCAQPWPINQRRRRRPKSRVQIAKSRESFLTGLAAAGERKAANSVHLFFCRVFMMSYAEKPEDITKDEWMEKLNNVHIQRADMNRLIMNYLVTEGFKEAAEKFRMESGIEPNIDLDSLDERIKIREMILKGQIQEGISLINSLHPELLDTNRYLYFHLQQQHLIELIRQRETEAALEFAQTQLAEQGEESRECLTEMERTLALLAFDNPEDSPFGDLLNMMQRQKVWSEVNQAVLDYENRESTPKLAKLLKLLLWAQNELDQKKVKYPKMTDLSKGTIEEPK
ncbi:glucose-induced degradation protein 8-B homolog isoform X1 [Acipenser ruthenus]|nr:glucose-induced degradation protein 8-B homolog isoform X1 [Acipenser ruthenus]